MNNFMELADPYSDAVECIGMIHSSKKVWDKHQSLILTKFGIEQARLLAWGDIVGICSNSEESRDAFLESPQKKETIIKTLKEIIAIIQPADKKHYHETFGLKPIKRNIEDLEHALDYTRMEVFRDNFSRLTLTARSPKITGSHWSIHDPQKTEALLAQIKSHIDSLIALFDVESRVTVAMKSDIRAFAWHPVFDKHRAAADGQKLRLIKDVCETTYPDYSQAASDATAYLNKEWNDSYEEAMERMAVSVRDSPSKKKQTVKDKGIKAMADAEAKRARSKSKQAEMQAMGLLRTSEGGKDSSHGHIPHEKAKWEKEDKGSPKPKRRSIFNLPFKTPSWRKSSKVEDESEAQRALSTSAMENGTPPDEHEDGEDLMPARSRSLFAPPKQGLDGFGDVKATTTDQGNIEVGDKFAGIVSDERVVTGMDDEMAELQSVKSMASRHDFAPPYTR